MHQDSRDFGQVDASTCEHVAFPLWGERYTDGSRRFTILWYGVARVRIERRRRVNATADDPPEMVR